MLKNLKMNELILKKEVDSRWNKSKQEKLQFINDYLMQRGASFVSLTEGTRKLGASNRVYSIRPILFVPFGLNLSEKEVEIIEEALNCIISQIDNLEKLT
jgi:hypothetical protein